MNLLLDTHIALWAITDSPKLTTQARELIEAPSAIIWVSTATLWEITIKHTLGRGEMPISGADALHYFKVSGYRILSIDAAHVLAVAELANYHQDPFDRILVAQALTEPMRLLTHDRVVAQYSDTILYV